MRHVRKIRKMVMKGSQVVGVQYTLFSNFYKLNSLLLQEVHSQIDKIQYNTVATTYYEYAKL